MTLYLCGFMGCGKSTVGNLLSAKLGMKFIDLDEYITASENCSIPQIFEKKGEKYFRKTEAAAIKKLSGDGCVIACGGGTILNDNSAATAKENGTVIFLDVSFDKCYDRIKHDSNRPLVVNNTEQQLKDIFTKRHDIYMKNSDISVNADKSPIMICNDIILSVKNQNCGK